MSAAARASESKSTTAPDVAPPVTKETRAPESPAANRIPHLVGNFAMQRFASLSGGEPLDPAIRASFEGSFGRSLAPVRVHAGPEAVKSAHDFNARAFTAGSDIVFGKGEYRPHTTEGQRLIAHELAHVVQQHQGIHLKTPQPQNDPKEREADTIAESATHRKSVASLVHCAPADEEIADRVANDPVDGVSSSDNGTVSQPLRVAPIHAGESSTLPREIPHDHGSPLPNSARTSFERRLGSDLSKVRIHAGSEADSINQQLGARAFTAGNHIFFGSGQYDPSSSESFALLAHEVTHTVQQRGLAAPVVQCQKEKPKPKKKIIAVTLLVDLDKVILDLDDGTRVTIATSYNGKLKPGNYLVKRKSDGMLETEAASATPNQDGFILVYSTPPGVARTDLYYMRVISTATTEEKEGPPGVEGGKQKQPGPVGKVEEKQGPGEGKEGEKLPELSAKAQAKWRAINELMTGSPETENKQDPAEILRLFQVLIDTVEDPQFSMTKGEPWLRFAEFLDKNRGKIEGILQGKPEGTLTEQKIEKIIAEYGKYIAAEPVEPPDKSKLETLEDFDKEFAYDPGWQRLSKEDRKLLLEYARMTPEEASNAKVDFDRVTPDMKVSMALKLSWKSWPGEIGQAAKDSFSDPAFVISLVAIMGIYVALWLTPDPTFITKVAAGALTAVLLAQFAWDDIYGFAVAYSNLRDECTAATSIPELMAAGDRFAKKVGQVGFDILMFIVMWRIGKRLTPKLQKIGARRGVANAEANVEATKKLPGSGAPKTAEGAAATLLETAKGQAKGTTATSVIDALANMPEDVMPEAAKKSLAKFRKTKSDLEVFKMLEAKQGEGKDIAHFLSEKMTPPEVVRSTQAKILEAQGKLVRAKLIEMETLADPTLTDEVKAARLAELVSSAKQALSEQGIFDLKVIREATKSGSLDELTSSLAEAIQRTQLAGEYPPEKNFRILSNVEIVREVPGFSKISAWQVAERTAGRSGDVGGLYEKNGKLWKSITEMDALVVKEGKGGKLRPVELEEMKSGSESAKSARAKNQKAVAGLTEVASGRPEVKIFDRTGKNTLGDERTGDFDLSGLSELKTTTRGAPDKISFDKNIPFPRKVLKEVAKLILKDGLPPKPPIIPPITWKQKEEPAGVGR